MKKTIQTNIAGVVFNIEEDAYEKLIAYLKAIEQYFSKYEGSKEIISDIETRIAEKFLDKQKTDNISAITTDHVNQVVASMGSVADFEAIEEEEDLASAKKATNGSQQSAEQPKSEGEKANPKSEPFQNPHSKYFRDTKRKALGGVLAGLAYHFNIDVVWIRLIFLIFFFGIAPLSNGDLAGISGILFIAYIVCWIAFPANNTLEEDAKVKKFYRNPDQKVVGGVASGLAAYFGVDLGVMRFLFVLGIFAGGIGLIAYILLWIVAPKATTLTQKMEMKGEPVTLENIETNIKSGLNLDKNDTETPAAKILLLPFRAIAAVLSAFGQIFKHLGPVVRIFTGIILLILSLSWMFGILAAAAVFYGLLSDAAAPFIHFGDIPVKMLTSDISSMIGVLGFLVFFLPAFAIGLIGISLLTSQTLMGNRTYWLTGLGLWIVSCLGFGTMIGTYSLNFARHGEHEVTKNFIISKNTLVLDSHENDSEFFNDVRLDLEGYEGTDLKLVQTFKASANTRAIAEKNAENINYNVVQKDSTLIFDSEVSIPPTAKFRKQGLEMKLYLPYNQPFTMTEDFAHGILYNDYDMYDKYELSGKDLKNFKFVMKKDSGIVCLNCIKKEVEKEESNSDNSSENSDNDNSNDADGLFAESMFDDNGVNVRSFNLNSFQKVDVSGAFVVNVKQGNNFNISADSDEKNALDELKAKVEGNTFKVYYEGGFFSNLKNHRKQVRINITMPKLEYIELAGASSGKIRGFEDKNDLTVHLSGASKAAVNVKVSKLTLEANGASTAELLGSAEKIYATVSGASSLQAKDMKTNSVEVQANGASSANFGNVSDFHSNTSGASSITRDN